MGRYAAEVYAHFARWMIHMKRQPALIAVSMVQPLLWLVVFSQALAQRLQATMPEGTDYPSFVAAAVVVMTVFNNSLAGGMPILFDREFGTLTRVLVAPIHRSTIFIGRFLAVGLMSLVQVLLILGAAGLMGVQPITGTLGCLAIAGLALLFGFGVTAISLTLAFTFRTHVEFFAVLAFVGLPLVFFSNALVEVSDMPGWLAAAVSLNPMTYCIAAVRGLVLHGWDLVALQRQVLMLLIFDAAAMALGVAVVRRKIG